MVRVSGRMRIPSGTGGEILSKVDALKKAGELLEVDRLVSPESEVAKAMQECRGVRFGGGFQEQWDSIPARGRRLQYRSKAIALQATEKDVFDKVLHGMATGYSPWCSRTVPWTRMLSRPTRSTCPNYPSRNAILTTADGTSPPGSSSARNPKRASRTLGTTAPKSSTSRPSPFSLFPTIASP
jgi:hypothetical protein